MKGSLPRSAPCGAQPDALPVHMLRLKTHVHRNCQRTQPIALRRVIQRRRQAACQRPAGKLCSYASCHTTPAARAGARRPLQAPGGMCRAPTRAQRRSEELGAAEAARRRLEHAVGAVARHAVHRRRLLLCQLVVCWGEHGCRCAGSMGQARIRHELVHERHMPQ